MARAVSTEARCYAVAAPERVCPSGWASELVDGGVHPAGPIRLACAGATVRVDVGGPKEN